jgi:hypothetical protein
VREWPSTQDPLWVELNQQVRARSGEGQGMQCATHRAEGAAMNRAEGATTNRAEGARRAEEDDDQRREYGRRSKTAAREVTERGHDGHTKYANDHQ